MSTTTDRTAATPPAAPGPQVVRVSVPKRSFASELRAIGPVSHVRLNIIPDGGVSRLRLWGRPRP